MFICIMGLFPFSEAKQNDAHYKLLNNKNYDKYWETIKKYSDLKDVSDEFKQLMQRIFSMDGNLRPTLQEIRADPWFNKPYNKEQVR